MKFLGFRQPISGLTHLVGAVLAILGLIFGLNWLVAHPEKRTLWHVLSFVIFCGSMILLYTSSTLYHLLPLSARALQYLRRLDHTMIYVFIAGCYTPICLITLRPDWGWKPFIVIWSFAAVGITLKWIHMESSRWLRIGIYLAMGWLAVAFMPPLWHRLPVGALIWLIAEGVAYTAGAIIYALKRPNPFPSFLGFHEIWHVFVMAGSFCHYWLIRQYILT